MKETKSKYSCDGVVCLNNGSCVNGTCNCPPPFTGESCAKLIIPIDSFTGGYHLWGTSTIYNPGQTPIVAQLEDTLIITKVNDSTLAVNGFQLLYQSAQPELFYRYAAFPTTYVSITIQYHKPFADDSVFYETTDSSPLGGATIVKMSGRKMY